MRQKNLENKEEILEIIRKCQVCTISMVDPDGKPYLVPMNFGFEEDVVYLHSAKEGKKIDILKNNPEVCINFTTDHELRYQNEDVACSWSMKYRSVLIYGKVEFVEDTEEKILHLNKIMKNYTPKDFSYNPPSLREVSCWKVRVERFEGRSFGY
jgi:nitroimidazol reductase NimA-like FMN-containing flavoprotein (pyridoxamine 5'-phosphate oxidase superfamily)